MAINGRADAKPPRRRVLLVEDHVFTLRAMVRILESGGHTVRSSADAAGALAWVVAEPFDVMVCDIGLPGVDDYELVRRVNDVVEIPAIAVTGYGAPDDPRRFLEAGFCGHLLKPFDLAALEAVIRGVLATRSSQSSRPANE